MGWARRVLIRLAGQLHSALLQVPLNLADIRKRVQLLCAAVPARIEGQQILFELALKQANRVRVAKVASTISAACAQNLTSSLKRRNFQEQW